MTCRRAAITLYDFELSASCYKVRLLLSLLKLDYERVTVNFFPGFEHRQAGVPQDQSAWPAAGAR